jgi:methionyl aminopeptidase
MAVAIRSKREIERIHEAGKIVAHVLSQLEQEAAVGITTMDLARISDAIIEDAGAKALFKGVKNPQAKIDFPSSICASVNEEVVHGIPRNRKLIDGDVISVDCGVKLNGYCGDSAVTLMIGTVEPEVQRLLKVTQEVLDIAVTQAKPGVYWSEIAQQMQDHAENAGYGVVKDYVGHGIGRQLHEDPKLPNYVSSELKNSDLLLREGMVLAVEPMVNMGTEDTKVLNDGWTVVTADGKPAAHFEHTIAITNHGCEVLTGRAG